jgi:PII-like signaling protein
VSADALKLTVYHGERDRIGDGFLADALAEVFTRHGVRASVVMRGSSGFGHKHHLRTDRLLTLSEDLPVVSVAVDEPARIEAAFEQVRPLVAEGLVTLERARFEPEGAPPDGEVKVTAYLGRGTDHRAVVAGLQAHGVAGASVLLGVDGTVGGVRRRARFFSRNAEVPVVVVSVGAGARIAAALAGLRGDAVVTVERVRVCKRDGRQLAEPERIEGRDEHGLPLWQMLTVYGSEDLVLALREAGAVGATALRGVWGYHGDHAPHGDTFWQLRRRVPTLTVVVDEPAAIRRLYPVVDRLTASGGLVTTETVPAAGRADGLVLAKPPPS